MKESLLGSFSGHPLVDYGRAAITAFSSKALPEDVTINDMEAFAGFVLRYYDSALLKKSFSVLWTTNWPINNSKLPKGATSAQRRAVGDGVVQAAVMSAASAGTVSRSTIRCDFCARQPSAMYSRERVPLLMGREPVNFGARGAAGGIPVCGSCASALMGLTLAPLCSGKILVIIADQPEATGAIAQVTIKNLRARASLVDAAQEPPAIKAPKSRVLDYLFRLEEKDLFTGGLTVYAFSNSGQGPSLDIYRLPAGVPRFLLHARRLGTEQVWRRFLKFGRSQAGADVPALEQRYQHLELLFDLPQQAKRLVQSCLLPFCKKLVVSKSPDSVHARKQLWNFISLFCEDVLMMDRDRLIAIERLGDTLANLASFDSAIPGRALRCDKYGAARALLLDSARRWSQRLGRPVIPFSDAVTIFESAEGPSSSWRLAWDLALIRMMERTTDQQVLEIIALDDISIPGETDESDVA